MGAILGFLGPVLQWLIKLLEGSGPSKEAAVAKEAGAAEANVQVEEKANAEVAQASAAGDAAARAVDSDVKLRQYESSDPNNRANSKA